jgi:hypothetical protein
VLEFQRRVGAGDRYLTVIPSEVSAIASASADAKSRDLLFLMRAKESF